MPIKKIPFTLEAWKAGGKPWTKAYGYIKQLTYFEVDDFYKLRGVSSDDNSLQSWGENGVWYQVGHYPKNNLQLEIEIDNTFNLERALAGEPWGDTEGRIGKEIFYSKETEKVKAYCIWAVFEGGEGSRFNRSGLTISLRNTKLIML